MENLFLVYLFSFMVSIDAHDYVSRRFHILLSTSNVYFKITKTVDQVIPGPSSQQTVLFPERL